MKRKLLIVLVVLTSIFTISMAVPFILAGAYISKERTYYSKAGWNLSLEDFDKRFYPKMNTFFVEKLENIGICKKEDYANDGHYRDLFNSKDFNIAIEYLVSDRYCRFSFEMEIYNDSVSDFSYAKIEPVDYIITDFGLRYFYDYDISTRLMRDLYDENNTWSSKNTYYDSEVGQLGACYKRFSEDDHLFLTDKLIFRYSIQVLLYSDGDGDDVVSQP